MAAATSAATIARNKVINDTLAKLSNKVASPSLELSSYLGAGITKAALSNNYSTISKFLTEKDIKIEAWRRMTDASLKKSVDTSIQYGRKYAMQQMTGDRAKGIVNKVAQQRYIDRYGADVTKEGLDRYIMSKRDLAIRDAVIDNMSNSVDDLARTIGRRVDGAIRSSHLEVIEQLGPSPGLDDATTLFREQLIKDGLVSQDGAFQFVEINGRRYELESYSELLGRTTTREAFTQGTIDQALAEGADLVKISGHASTCEICGPFEYKIFSISGTSPDHPMLTDAPPFHPNCGHIITIYG